MWFQKLFIGEKVALTERTRLHIDLFYVLLNYVNKMTGKVLF